jgi:hypothetical protein
MRGLLLAIVLLVGPAAVILEGCSPSEKPVCAFDKGDIVRTVIGNQVGQVVHVYTNCARYKVRFSGHQIFTDTHLIDRDGPLNARPFFTDSFKAFELQGGDRERYN